MIYDVIICDLGNVLVDFDHRIAVKKLLNLTAKSEKDIYDLFFDSPLTELYETGKITTDDFFKRVKESLGLRIGLDKFLPIWNEIFFETPKNKKVRDFLEKAGHGHKLTMLSNINVTHYEYLRNTTSVFDAFDKLVLSYEVGYRKPSPEIYEYVLNAMKVSPEKAFYIDDRRDLIEAASYMGISGVVLDGEEALKKIEAIL